MTERLGVDFGGTGIKAAIVDIDEGSLVTDRFRLDTPHPSTPEAVAATVREVAAGTGWEGPAGVAVPAVVVEGIVRTAANIDAAWIGTDAEALFTQALGGPITALNDADAAGVAEARLGAGDHPGTVLVLTLGTGIGSALFVGGRLVPNTELGHIVIDGRDAEDVMSAKAREEAGLDFEEWANLLNRYLDYVELLLWPDLIVIGGGIIKRAGEFMHLLESRAPMVPARLLNNAGIVGAALASHARDP